MNRTYDTSANVRNLLVVGVEGRGNRPSPSDPKEGDHELDLQAESGAHRHQRQLGSVQHDSVQQGAYA